MTLYVFETGFILVERMKKAESMLQSTSTDLEGLMTDSSGGIPGYLLFIYLNLLLHTQIPFLLQMILEPGILRIDQRARHLLKVGGIHMHVYVSHNNHLVGQIDSKWQECYVQHLNSYWTIQ